MAGRGGKGNAEKKQISTRVYACTRVNVAVDNGYLHKTFRPATVIRRPIKWQRGEKREDPVTMADWTVVTTSLEKTCIIQWPPATVPGKCKRLRLRSNKIIPRLFSTSRDPRNRSFI